MIDTEKLKNAKSIRDVGDALCGPGATDKILAEIKANTAKLESCAGPHEFTICLDRRTKEPIQNPMPIQMFGAYWRCVKCGGMIEATNKSWYNKGVLHGTVVQYASKNVSEEM